MHGTTLSAQTTQPVKIQNFNSTLCDHWLRFTQTIICLLFAQIQFLWKWIRYFENVQLMYEKNHLLFRGPRLCSKSKGWSLLNCQIGSPPTPISVDCADFTSANLVLFNIFYKNRAARISSLFMCGVGEFTRCNRGTRVSQRNPHEIQASSSFRARKHYYFDFIYGWTFFPFLREVVDFILRLRRAPFPSMRQAVSLNFYMRIHFSDMFCSTRVDCAIAGLLIYFASFTFDVFRVQQCSLRNKMLTTTRRNN
jgi:hypothetical protein